MKQWIKLQDDLYRESLAQAKAPVAKKSPSLRAYERRYLNDQRSFEISTTQQMLRAVNQSTLTLVGDFHTLRQSQRFFLRLLRDRRLKKPEAIALEVVKKSHLKTIHAFLKNRSSSSEDHLKRALQLESHWGSHFETYRSIFEIAYNEKIDIIPLYSPKKNLRARDRAMAQTLLQQKKRIWVLVGEFHCARAHLPADIIKISPSQKICIVRQNDDAVYKKHQERGGIIARRDAVYASSPTSTPHKAALFCVLHTPLWIKYQSLFEHYIEGDEREGGEMADPQAQIVWSLEALDRFLRDPRYDLKPLQKFLKNIHVFKSDSPGFYRVLNRFNAKAQRELLRQIKTAGVAVSFRDNSIFLSETTINACSQAAGLYLYQAWSGLKLEELSRIDHLLMETLAFFLSKLLNHSRKAPREAFMTFRNFFARGSQTMTLRALEKMDLKTLIYLARELGDLCFEAFLAEEFARSRLLRILQSNPHRDQRSALYLSEMFSLALSFRRRERGL